MLISAQGSGSLKHFETVAESRRGSRASRGFLWPNFGQASPNASVMVEDVGRPLPVKGSKNSAKTAAQLKDHDCRIARAHAFRV